MQPVRHLLRRAAEQRTRGGGFQRRLTQSQTAFAGVAFDFIGGAAKTVLAQRADIRERFIQRVLREVVVFEVAAEVIERICNSDQRGGILVLTLHVFRAITHQYADALKDMQLVFAPPLFHQLLLNVAVKRLCLRQRVLVGEDGIRVAGGQFLAVIRCAGLEDNRPALWRAADVQRPGDREEFTLMVQRMQFLRVEEAAAGLVADKRVVFPGVPQSFHHLQKFIGDAVAQGVFRVLGAREVFCRPFQRRGHHVPAGAAVAQMVEAGELPRGGKRLAVRGG